MIMFSLCTLTKKKEASLHLRENLTVFLALLVHCEVSDKHMLLYRFIQKDFLFWRLILTNQSSVNA